MYEWNVVPLNIWLSQGSAATEFRCGGRFYFTLFRSLSTNPKVKELLKWVHICQSYRKNKSGTFFCGPRCIFSKFRIIFSTGAIWKFKAKIVNTISNTNFAVGNSQLPIAEMQPFVPTIFFQHVAAASVHCPLYQPLQWTTVCSAPVNRRHLIVSWLCITFIPRAVWA